MALLETKTESGRVRGILSGYQKTAVYRGIPFAKPPVGRLRWRAPQPATPWEGVRDCSIFGPMPWQEPEEKAPVPEREVMYLNNKHFGLPMSEDCLYLNVWTPAQHTEERLPVLLWFFGGGYTVGRANGACVDGDMYAKRGVIFVSANYRLNVFGFLCHPELAKEDAHGSSGNYGIMDQIAALKWVKRNIAAFGGDPENISVMGLSAGSRTVQNLCLCPFTQQDIQHAINMSGAGIGSWQSLLKWDLEEAGKVGTEFFKKAGIRDVEQARQLPAAKLMEEFRRQQRDYVGWKVMRPCIDGYLFQAQFIDLYKERRFADISYMIGVAADENDGFYKNPDPDKPEKFIELIRENYGEQAKEMLKIYGIEEPERFKESMLRLRTDDLRAAALAWCEYLTEVSCKRPYLYYFDHVPKSNPKGVGAYHGMDEIFALDSLHRAERRYSGEDYEVAARMADYFTNFIKCGNPNGSGLPEWKAYEHGAYNAMTFAHGGGMKRVPTNEVIDYKMKFSLEYCGCENRRKYL